MSIIRLRTKKLIIAGVIGAIAMLMLSSIIMYLSYTALEEKKNEEINQYQEKIAEAEALLAEQQKIKKKVYVLKHDVPAGKKISEEDVVVMEIQTDILPENIADPEYVLGKFTKIELKKQTPIVRSMLFEEGIIPADIREAEFGFITLPTKLKKDDFVDVRISFPTGNDYVVLSKKKVKDIKDGTVWHELNEEEILRLSSAIVDAYLNSAYLYSLAYVDPYMQDGAVVTYPVNLEVLELMIVDPNVVNYSKKELEARMRKHLNTDLEKYHEKNMVKPTQTQDVYQKRFGEKEYPQFSQQQEETDPIGIQNTENIFNEPVSIESHEAGE